MDACGIIIGGGCHPARIAAVRPTSRGENHADEIDVPAVGRDSGDRSGDHGFRGEFRHEARSSEPGGWSTPLDRAAAERGRTALVLEGFLKPEWSTAAYRNAGRQWEGPVPDPEKDPAAYEAAFRQHYGLHPAPYPNDRLPMGLRRGIGPGGVKSGLQIDCMLCHGGSIGGQSYIGLGNTQLDLKAVLFELTIADGKSPAVLNVRAQFVTRHQ